MTGTGRFIPEETEQGSGLWSDELSDGAAERARIRILSRPATGHDRGRAIEIEALETAISSGELVWVDLFRPQTSASPLLGDSLQLGPLTVEDCLLPVRMPKLDTLPDGAFAAAFAIDIEEGDEPRLRASPVSMVIGPRYLVTVRRAPIPEVSNRLNAILNVEAQVPELSGPALAHAALDALVDRHLPTTVRAAELAEDLEELLDPRFERESMAALERLIVLRRDLLAFRRLGVAQQEVLRRLGRIFPELRAYLSDVADDQREAIDTAAATCDYIDGAIEAFRVRRDARTEQGIRRLTVLAAIFGPLSLTTALWGSNFQSIPGTNTQWGWYAFVVVQVIFVVGAVIYYRRRRLI
jgi:magnesium transporter